jgi:KilA-N domain
MADAKKIRVEDKLISIVKQYEQDYICLTDMVRGEEGSDHIRNWMRNRNTVEFLGLWETLHNPDFKGVEFDRFRKESGLNNFNLTLKKRYETGRLNKN